MHRPARDSRQGTSRPSANRAFRALDKAIRPSAEFQVEAQEKIVKDKEMCRK